MFVSHPCCHIFHCDSLSLSLSPSLSLSLSHTQQKNKEIGLGMSKLNYLDPRISVAWCRKWDIPVEKIYNKTQREKFAWAINMADEDFVF